MTTQDKRLPALTDSDFPPFGKHSTHGSDPLPLQDVPARYLAWLWREAEPPLSEYSGNGDLAPTYLANKRKLANYIWNSKSAIEQEIGETL